MGFASLYPSYELAPIKERFPDFADLLEISPGEDLFTPLRAAESIGRPLGDNGFLTRIERLTKRSLKPGKCGPKPMDQNDARRQDG